MAAESTGDFATVTAAAFVTLAAATFAAACPTSATVDAAAKTRGAQKKGVLGTDTNKN